MMISTSVPSSCRAESSSRPPLASTSARGSASPSSTSSCGASGRGAWPALVSRTRTSGDWSPTTVVSDTAALRRAADDADGDLLVIGSSELLQSLLAEGLVDALHVWTFPVVLGEGKRLFGRGTRPAGLELQDAEVFPSGVIRSEYLPVV